MLSPLLPKAHRRDPRWPGCVLAVRVFMLSHSSQAFCVKLQACECRIILSGQTSPGKQDAVQKRNEFCV